MKQFEMKDGNILRIEHDNYAESPRDWDNLGTMYCWHRRYTLGDDHNIDHNDYTGWDELEEALTDAEGITLPLYLYDHGNLAISTEPFNCRWDSGRVGLITISKEKIIEEYGDNSVETRVRVLKYLKNEVETYHKYLSGEVYGFTLFSPDGEILDSCCGFFGYDHEKSGLLECAGYKLEDVAWNMTLMLFSQ